MSQEILYTSAPRGIRPGSQGFCTVKSTAGIGKSLAERLEALSGYRHAYPPPDPRAVDNPVNFAHVILNAGGQQYHVLSRIADAGLDYTRRTNKIAHHVALENFGELTEGGPAWALEDAAFCETQFDGEPCVLPAGRTPRGGNRLVTDCQEWAKLTNDPGWAGALAETMFDSRNRQVTIIFKAGLPPGTTLKLVAEAIALLPPDKRWDVTFSTYFTGLPADIDCRWRFLLDDTKEATQARNNPHAILIDLCNPLKRAEGGTLVEAARAGKAPQWAEVAPATPIRPAYVPPAASAAASQPLAPLDELQPLPGDPLGLGGVLAPPVTPARPKKAAAKKKKPLPYPVIIVGMAVVLLAAIAFLLKMLGGGKPDIDPEEFLAKAKTEAASKQTSDGQPAQDDRIKQKTPEPEKPKETKAPQTLVAAKKDDIPPPEVKPKEDLFDEKNALVDLLRKNGQLALPERAQGLATASIPATEIARIKAPPKLCRLELKGAEHVLDGGLEYQLKEEDRADGSRTWTVRAINKQGLGGGQNVAKFSLKDESLKFQWDPNVKQAARAEKLACCTLEVLVGKEPAVVCSLIQPQTRDHLQVQDLFGEVRIAIPWRQATAAFKVEQLRVEMRLEGFPPNEMRGQLPIGNTDILTFEFLKENSKAPQGFLSLEMRCDIEEGKAVSLALNSFVYPQHVTADGAKPQREQLTKSAMEKWRLATTEAKIRTLQTQKAKLELTEIPRLKKLLLLERTRVPMRAKQAEIEFPISDKTPGEQKPVLQQQRDMFTHGPVRQAESNVKAAEGEAILRQQMIEQIKLAGQWYQRLERLLDDIVRGRIEYRLYGEVKGAKKQIVLVESKSFGDRK